MREAKAVKTHYPNGSTLLDKAFDEAFHHEKGPGALPASKLDHNETVKGIIVPHAPYTVAAPCAAWAYKSLAESPQETDVYIIVAQAQYSTQTGGTMQTFLTPYGEVRVDQAFMRELVAKGHIALHDEAHNKETLIEVQLPFLQFINKNQRERIKIVPLLIGPDTPIGELTVDIKETLLEQDKTATFIFVSNFTSYGRDFHYVPFTEDIQENIVALDKQLFDALTNHDQEAFFSVVKESMIPLSGYAVFEMYFKLFATNDIALEQYYLSGDITGSYTSSVSYASLIIK